jgi:hypothetical protein
LALDWLREGLATSGIGAKTAAGYGWFEDCTSRLKPWWQLAAQVARLREAHLCFAAYPPEKKDDLVLELADKLEACRAWAQMDSDSFNPINKYALSQQIRLL